MGGEQAATVLATITRDQREREGKEVRPCEGPFVSKMLCAHNCFFFYLMPNLSLLTCFCLLLFSSPRKKSSKSKIR